MKHLQSFDEFLNESSNNYSMEDIFITIDGCKESYNEQLYKDLGSEYIDTPGNFEDEFEDYEDIVDFLRSNMGSKTFDKLHKLIDKNLKNKDLLDYMKANYDPKYIKSVTK